MEVSLCHWKTEHFSALNENIFSQIMGHGPFNYEKTLGAGLTQVLFSVFTRHLGNIIIRTYIVEKAAAVYVMLNDFDVLWSKVESNWRAKITFCLPATKEQYYYMDCTVFFSHKPVHTNFFGQYFFKAGGLLNFPVLRQFF